MPRVVLFENGYKDPERAKDPDGKLLMVWTC